MSKILILDGQVFQTPALFRGMGKYTNELMRALITLNNEKKVWDEIEVVLSSNITVDYVIQDELFDWYGEVTVRHLDTQANQPGAREVTEHNKKTIDDYVARYRNNNYVVDFLVPAIFQSEICPVFPTSYTKNILLMHDLIPLVFSEVYLKEENIRLEYLTKLSECFRADLHVTVSKTVANDLCRELGVDRQRIVPILGGAINHSAKSNAMATDKPFILMPTGNDVRKNNKKGIQGFEIFNERHNNKYELIVTSHFLEHEVEEFSRLSRSVRFVGNISGENLNYLYDKCKALLFPTEYEGLGLPILEAVERQRPVACSDIAVFKEMSQTGFEFFDYSNARDIADAIERAINSIPLEEEYTRVLQSFSWMETANRALNAITSAPARKPQPIGVSLFAPDPSVSVAGELAQFIAEELTFCTYYSRYGSTNNKMLSEGKGVNYLPYLWPFTIGHKVLSQIIPPEWKPIYIIDGSAESAEILCKSLAESGVVILLDSNLSGVWESALKAGLISQQRYDLEHKLQDRLGHSHGLASLLYSQNKIVVCDQRANKIVNELYDKLPNPNGILLSRPYRMTLPEVDYVCPELVDGGLSGSPAMSSTKFIRQLLEIMEGS